MRRKLADDIREHRQDSQSSLTISLGGLDLLEKALEPSKGRSVTTDPEEFNPPQRTHLVLLLAVPDMLQNGCERRDT